MQPASTAQEAPRAKAAINAALDIFHRRWVLRILWELRHGPLTFSALQDACGKLSPTVLNQRLHELREAALVVHAPGAGYTLTQLGSELLVAMRPMVSWATRWYEASNNALV